VSTNPTLKEVMRDLVALEDPKMAKRTRRVVTITA
jgi:hypothetical protein